MPNQQITFGMPHTYTLEKLLNETDYSKVYQAHDDTANRMVCIKQIDLQIFEGTVKASLENIKREVVVMTTVGEETPNVPCLLDSFADKENGKFYIVMQLFQGKTLREKMSEPIPAKTFLQYMIDLCGALEAMHRNHLYHKDVKPENIMITQADGLVLLDFNLTITTPNLYEGTPGYRAPEMELRDMTTDRSWSDVFAVGLIMYEYFARVRPENGIHYVVEGQGWGDFLLPSENPNARPIPQTLEQVIMKCLAFKPKQRYNVKFLRQELIRIQKDEKLWRIKKTQQPNT